MKIQKTSKNIKKTSYQKNQESEFKNQKRMIKRDRMISLKMAHHDKQSIKEFKIYKNIWKMQHQKSHIRKQSIKKFLKCNWYIKNIDTMELQKLRKV